MNFEHEISQLKDTLIIMAEIQRRQAEVQKNSDGEACRRKRGCVCMSSA
jgi:hypothetical protein